jgi:hypothetical protein
MPDSDLSSLARDARRKLAMRPHPRCERCRTTRHLVDRGGRVLCYACRRVESGGSPTELDHPAGRANVSDFVVRLTANDHRTATDWRIRLGVTDWPAADGDPLLTLAHFLAGIATLLLLWAEWLVALAGQLSERLGPGWWAGLAQAPVVP